MIGQYPFRGVSAAKLLSYGTRSNHQYKAVKCCRHSEEYAKIFRFDLFRPLILNNLMLWAANPKGNMAGASKAKNFWHVALLLRILSRKNRKKLVAIILSK